MSGDSTKTTKDNFIYKRVTLNLNLQRLEEPKMIFFMKLQFKLCCFSNTKMENCCFQKITCIDRDDDDDGILYT